MNITVTADKPVDEKLTVKVTVPAAEVDAAIKQAYKDIANKYSRVSARAAHLVLSLTALLAARQSLLRQPTIFSAQQSQSFLRSLTLFQLAVAITTRTQTFLLRARITPMR